MDSYGNIIPYGNSIGIEGFIKRIHDNYISNELRKDLEKANFEDERIQDKFISLIINGLEKEREQKFQDYFHKLYPSMTDGGEEISKCDERTKNSAKILYNQNKRMNFERELFLMSQTKIKSK